MGDYDQLAALLGRFPNLAMFRSFARLSTKTLLYMQADLIHLEDQLADIEHEDSCSQDQQKNSYKHSWRALSQSPEERGGDIQLRKVEEIRRKIQEYHFILLQYAQVQRLRRPKEEDLRFLREWLERPEFGNNFLCDREAGAWEESSDLVALAGKNTEKDTFASWISSKCVPWFHRRVGYRIRKPITTKYESNIFYYPDELILVISNIMCTILSSFLLVAATFVLYHLNNPGARLICFTVFNVLYAFVLAVVANARKVEIFAATSAFAAVQVVFVGGVNFFLPSGGLPLGTQQG